MQRIGTALEKRRLEDDEAGSITENRSGHPDHGVLNLEEVFRKLDEEQERLEEQQRQEQECVEQQRHQGLEKE